MMQHLQPSVATGSSCVQGSPANRACQRDALSRRAPWLHLGHLLLVLLRRLIETVPLACVPTSHSWLAMQRGVHSSHGRSPPQQERFLLNLCNLPTRVASTSALVLAVTDDLPQRQAIFGLGTMRQEEALAADEGHCHCSNLQKRVKHVHTTAVITPMSCLTSTASFRSGGAHTSRHVPTRPRSSGLAHRMPWPAWQHAQPVREAASASASPPTAASAAAATCARCAVPATTAIAAACAAASASAAAAAAVASAACR